MWKQFNPDGTLTYGNFLETVTQIMPMYWMRAIGGSLYLVGMLTLVYNIIMTVKAGETIEDELAQAPALQRISNGRVRGEKFHSWLERKPIQLTILATIAILIGGIIQIVPTIMVKSNIPTISSVKPYTPLELEGRDLYIREGCVGCHSQSVRPFRSEVRTGPDLLRVGGKYNDNWHFNHFWNPQSISAGSIMPGYKWLFDNKPMDTSLIETKMKAMVSLGVPYTEADVANAQKTLRTQAVAIEKSLENDPDFVKSYEDSRKKAAAKGEKFIPMNEREIVALIAYIQRLGTDIKVKETK
jgi:cytochrome c oxidase cbb3-type subunit I/II